MFCEQKWKCHPAAQSRKSVSTADQDVTVSEYVNEQLLQQVTIPSAVDEYIRGIHCMCVNFSFSGQTTPTSNTRGVGRVK